MSLSKVLICFHACKHDQLQYPMMKHYQMFHVPEGEAILCHICHYRNMKLYLSVCHVIQMLPLFYLYVYSVYSVSQKKQTHLFYLDYIIYTVRVRSIIPLCCQRFLKLFDNNVHEKMPKFREQKSRT